MLVSALLLTAVGTRGVAEHVELAQPAEEPRDTYLKDLSEWHGIEPQWEVCSELSLVPPAPRRCYAHTAQVSGAHPRQLPTFTH